MKVKQIRNNFLSIQTKDITAYKSYDTVVCLVGIPYNEKEYATVYAKYSATTSRHLNEQIACSTSIKVSQEEMERLVNKHLGSL